MPAALVRVNNSTAVPSTRVPKAARATVGLAASEASFADCRLQAQVRKSRASKTNRDGRYDCICKSPQGLLFVRRFYIESSPSAESGWGASRAPYFATGIVNSAPLAILSGQRCMTLL